jgi:hypothetical protein
MRSVVAQAHRFVQSCIKIDAYDKIVLSGKSIGNADPHDEPPTAVLRARRRSKARLTSPTDSDVQWMVCP